MFCRFLCASRDGKIRGNRALALARNCADDQQGFEISIAADLSQANR